ncbi:MAG: YigZ family protein [Acholeplasmatales bacterium]|nr:YigZ family protein [Acholeplasmatales bacterium]
MYKIIDSVENTITIQKSEFITHIYRVNSIEEINSILEETRKKYYDATHNCYAYILGENQDIQKCSDDGEPQKTAGAPMMNVLKQNDMTNILAIVTRYFGGILLGAGGLIRAYSSAVSEALKLCKRYVTKEVSLYMLTTSYSSYNNLINIKDINIIDSSFTNDVIITFGIAKEKENGLEELLYKNKIDVTSLKKIQESLIEIPAE